MSTEPLQYLDTFAEAAERSNFTAAARALGLNQAALRTFTPRMMTKPGAPTA